MSALTMQPAGLPHRKPLPGYAAHQQTHLPPPTDTGFDFGHSRTRSTSSNAIPVTNAAPPAVPERFHPGMAQSSQQQQQQHQLNPAFAQSSRRTLSNATSSTSSTGTNPGMQRLSTNSTGFVPPRRSTSSRSNGSASPTSYVALMRRQKATVWCDRAQHEDPRILAAQRAAKMRAQMEVAGGHNHAARVSTSSSGVVGGVRSKITHRGATKASTFNAGLTPGSSVPIRLSATEVDEGDSDEESAYPNKYHHSRNGSGRSSLGSGYKGHQSLNSHLGGSSGSTPPGQHNVSEGMAGVPEEPTPVPGRHDSDDYFSGSGGKGGSGGSIQREENFGGVGHLPQSRKPDPVRSTEEDLKRRGSVDDRTMTMGGGRLFVANPDLSD